MKKDYCCWVCCFSLLLILLELSLYQTDLLTLLLKFLKLCMHNHYQQDIYSLFHKRLLPFLAYFVASFLFFLFLPQLLLYFLPFFYLEEVLQITLHCPIFKHSHHLIVFFMLYRSIVRTFFWYWNKFSVFGNWYNFFCILFYIFFSFSNI